MKIEKISKRIKEIDKFASDTIRETNQQIDSLNDRLAQISSLIEETYRSGDIEKGQQLAEEKAVIESKVAFLKTFMEKRKAMSLMTEDEAKKLRSDLNNELYNIYYEQKKKVDALFTELDMIHEEFEKTISEANNIGNGLIRLSKSGEIFYQVDQKISTLNGDLRLFTKTYKDHQNILNSQR